MRLINFGSLNIDYVYQMPHFVRPGETLGSLDLAVNCGGKGLNQSIAAAKAGMEVFHAGFIGEEGLFLKEKLAKEGVNVEHVELASDRTGHAIIQVDPQGENCILLYGGANFCLTEDYVRSVLDKAQPGDMVLLQNETSCMAFIIREAAARGLQVAMNAAPSASNLKNAPLEKLSYLIVNETEGAYLADCTEPDAILSVLHRMYPDTTIVLTLGGDGSRVQDAFGSVSCGTFRVPVVDTTAAGDTFTGYYLKCAAEGREAYECLRTASAASALAIQKPGAADSVPSWADVEAFLREQK